MLLRRRRHINEYIRATIDIATPFYALRHTTPNARRTNQTENAIIEGRRGEGYTRTARSHAPRANKRSRHNERRRPPRIKARQRAPPVHGAPRQRAPGSVRRQYIVLRNAKEEWLMSPPTEWGAALPPTRNHATQNQQTSAAVVHTR